MPGDRHAIGRPVSHISKSSWLPAGRSRAARFFCCPGVQRLCGYRMIFGLLGDQVSGLTVNRFVQKRPTRILSDQGRREGICRLPSMPSPYSTSPMTAGPVGSERVRRHPHHRPRSALRAASPAVPVLSGPGPHRGGRPRRATRPHAAALPTSAIFLNSARTSGWCRSVS